MSEHEVNLGSAAPSLGNRRRQDLARLASEQWDLVVVGGGIVGAGALLDASSRGLRAALIEQQDLGAGTSSRSSRLIHGGLRYLEQFRFGLVHEALAERARLLRLAPHLIRIEPFMFPLYGRPLVTRAFYGTGMLLYDALGSARDGGRHRHLRRDAVLTDASQGALTVAGHQIHTTGAVAGHAPGSHVQIAVRPESLHLGEVPQPVNVLHGILYDVTFLGSTVRLRLSLDDRTQIAIDTFNVADSALPEIGSALTVSFPASAVLVLDDDSRAMGDASEAVSPTAAGAVVSASVGD